MSNWYVVVPEYTKNLVLNPSFENDLTGYTAVAGGTLERTNQGQRRGIYAARYTPTATTNDGLYYELTLLASTTYTFSVDIYAANGVPYQIYAYDVTAATVLGSPATFTGADNWTRRSVTFTTGANTTIRLYVAKNNSASTAVFYVDGWQCEQKSYATTYCDGDRDGCSWTAAAHASASERNAQHYAGGRVVDIESLQLVGGQTRGFRVEQAQGVGMPPISHVASRPALGDGQVFQRSLAGARVFSLIGTFSGQSFEHLPRMRGSILDVVKFDRLATQQPLQLRFAGYDDPVAIDCRYDAGLEALPRQAYNERVGLRFVAHDPYWRAVIGVGGADSAGNGTIASGGPSAPGPGDGVGGGGGVLVPSVQASVPNANYIIQRSPTGVWSALGTGRSDTIMSLGLGPDGRLYAGGISEPAPLISYWDGSSWTNILGNTLQLDPGGIGVVDIAFSPNGTLYIAGFVVDSLIPPPEAPVAWVLYWDGTNWRQTDQVGNNYPNAGVRAILFGPDGSLYAGGDFTQIGTTSYNYIAKYDGSAWSALGAGMNGAVYDLAMGPDGALYACGAFTTAGGVTVNYIAKWDGSAWSALGGGITTGDTAPYGRCLAVSPEGTLYLGGSFTAVDSVSANYIAKWNGSNWAPLGGGVLGSVETIAILGENLYAGGAFGKLGDTGRHLSDAVAKWNGAVWTPITITLPGAAQVRAILAHPDGALTLGYDTSGTATAAGVS